MAARIKAGDTVVVIAGKDRGKSGKVLQVFTKEDRVVVEGVNKMVKHLKPSRAGEKGQRLEFNGPIHLSNVMMADPKTGKPTRVKFDMREKNGKPSKVRVAVASGADID